MNLSHSEYTTENISEMQAALEMATAITTCQECGAPTMPKESVINGCGETRKWVCTGCGKTREEIQRR